MSSILNILTDVLQLEMNCFGYIGHTSGGKRKVITDILENSFEHCFWVYIHGWIIACERRGGGGSVSRDNGEIV